jgi:2-polyprenyl-6-methoxyphenol hydroxylase-like FAD-dependent oxidoreductase
MNKVRVLISGAGVAGPALAYWLTRWGYETVVVERAPSLREGGQAVDFRGPVHRAVLERMGIWDAIHERRTTPGALLLVDRDDGVRATLPESMLSGDVEILRGDLCNILHERTHGATDYRFGDRIVGIDDRGDSVAVEFARAPAESFDFVVGADGLHSGVRALAMADEADVVRHHGYRVASFATPNLLGRLGGASSFCEPGRGACLTATSATKGRALLVSTGGPVTGDERDPREQKRAIAERFAGMGWNVPQVLAYLRDAPDLYVDAIATVHLGQYSKGRVALLGDAAWGGTLGGQGTSLAIVGAYVFAHELARSRLGDDPKPAFARYEEKMRPYAAGCQKGATRTGQFLAPGTRFGVWMRDVVYGALTSRLLGGTFERIVRSAASDFDLPDYDALPPVPPSSLSTRLRSTSLTGSAASRGRSSAPASDRGIMRST